MNLVGSIIDAEFPELIFTIILESNDDIQCQLKITACIYNYSRKYFLYRVIDILWLVYNSLHSNFQFIL